jgi:hypothetical protein
VNWSYGVFNSFGVDRAIFLANKKRTQLIFGKEVSEERYNEVWDKLHNKLNGWKPSFNNAFELYLKSGGEWGKVEAEKIYPTLENWQEPYEAWKTMPKEAIDYLISLPEFDAEIFKIVTEINVEQQEQQVSILAGKTH